MTTGYGGGVTMTVGPGSVAVPGAVAALDLAHSRHGRLPWREVVDPARRAAADGFPLGSAAAHYLAFVRDSAYGWDPQTLAALRSPTGGWLEAGDRMVLDGLADTVALIADEGARTMHDGALAEALVADQAARGGLVTAADLSAYRPVLRDSLPVRAGAWSLRTNPPPAIGGPVLAAMLTLLGPPPGRTMGARTTSRTWSPCSATSSPHAVSASTRPRTGPPPPSSCWPGWVGPRPGWPSTAHISVVDAAGTACAVTTSHGYGSGATVPGTGLWLNNCLGEHELNRGGPDAPGTRLASNMAPTVGRRDDGAVLAIGSPGADRITTALLQVLASFAYGGASLQEAVDRPRLHVHVLDDDVTVRVEAEEDLPLPALDLTVRRHPPHSMYFGGVGAALRLPDGTVQGAADPRRAGVVLASG